MPDIEQRLHADMLVVSAPIDAALARQGIDFAQDYEYLLVTEPDAIIEALRMELLAGAQCLALPTRAMTPAKLAHYGAIDRLPELAQAAYGLVRGGEEASPLVPQHLLVEIGFCGLPLDASSKSSLNEHRDQYARAVRAFEACGPLDAYLFTGFRDATALKCALMGARQATDRPVFACIDAASDGSLASGRGTIEDAAAVAAEYGANAFGIATGAPIDAACDLVRRCSAASSLPVIAEIDVREGERRTPSALQVPTVPTADELARVALELRAAGAEFLRAGGLATPAYTGALAAVVTGLSAPAGVADE